MFGSKQKAQIAGLHRTVASLQSQIDMLLDAHSARLLKLED